MSVDDGLMNDHQRTLYVLAAGLGLLAVIGFITCAVQVNGVNPYMDAPTVWHSGLAWGLIGAGATAVGVVVFAIALATHAVSDHLAAVVRASRSNANV